MPDVPEPGSGPRLVDAMPRPLLILFVVLGVVALGGSIYLLLQPPERGEVPLGERRAPPAAPYSHDPVEVFTAPTPSSIPDTRAPCEEVAGVRAVGGVSFVRRMERVLQRACEVAGPGVPQVLADSVAGLAETELRIAEFTRTGLETTADRAERVIYVNLKFTRRETPLEDVLPPLLHDAWHLLSPDVEITASDELVARTVEVEACRAFINPDRWPRWCADAKALTDLPRADAIELLVSAGYAREISS
jgi:hypothetical protein